MEDERPAVLRRAPLTSTERRRVVVVGLLPVAAAVVILVPVALLGPASITDALAAALLYGGLLGLAVGFVYVDRVQARQCPRCRHRRDRGDEACGECGYDLTGQPRFVCPERHRVYVEPGICDCGRRLGEVTGSRGIRHEVVAMLKLGAWLLAFLVGVGLVLRVIG